MKSILHNFAKREALPRTEDVQIAGGDNNSINLRIYFPASTTDALPVGVYFHGGGCLFVPVYDTKQKMAWVKEIASA